GMMSHMCVDGTARAAGDLGFKVIVAEDACATKDLKFGDTVIPADYVHKSFMAALRAYGDVMKSSEVIALLAGEREK
ncbi:MAG: isochorismatase family protein, partial [Anaerolineales bacterium]